MAIEPTKNVTVTSGVNQTQNGKNVQRTNTANIGQELTKGAKTDKASAKLPETPGEKTGGVVFAKGTLKSFESKEVRTKDEHGIFRINTVYVATLTDGTVVTYHKQAPIDDKNGNLQMPAIKRNKDGSIDFIGLRGAEITDTPKNDKYNLIGSEIAVKANNYNDRDIIDGAFLDLSHGKGTSLRGNDVKIEYNKGDMVFDPSEHSKLPEVKDYDGYILGMQGLSIERQFIENRRTRRTVTENGIENTAVYSHDDIELKESYVNATEKVLADGYKIKTSPDGKEQWFYTPDGKPISKKEFQNRGLE